MFPRWFIARTAALLALLTIMLPVVTAQTVDFSLPGLEGKPIRLMDYRNRWVFINFWASWCPPCLLEMPELQEFYEKHRDQAIVIGVNFEALTPDQARAFTDQLAITFPIALSGGNPLPGFVLKGLPTTFLVSPTGQLVDTHMGSVNAAMLAARLTEQQATVPAR